MATRARTVSVVRMASRRFDRAGGVGVKGEFGLFDAAQDDGLGAHVEDDFRPVRHQQLPHRPIIAQIATHIDDLPRQAGQLKAAWVRRQLR